MGSIRTVTGLAVAAFSILYLGSDLIELAQGGFSTGQLVLTYLAEAAIPLFVLALYAVQRPAIGRLGLWGAFAYAYAYIFFAGTVVYALAAHTTDWAGLSDALEPWMTVHGAVMVVAGLSFGWAVARAGVLPSWTGYTLMAGVCLVAATSAAPDPVRTVAAAVRAAAFIAMGFALLRRPQP